MSEPLAPLSRLMINVKALAAWGCALLATTAGAADWSWLNENLVKRIEVNGFRRLGYHVRSVSGDRDAYGIQTDGGLGGRRFTDIGQLTLTGRRVFGVLNFQATIQDDRFQDPLGQRFSLDYARDGWQVNLGDIQGAMLNTNRFATLSRSLRGVQLGYARGGLQARILTSSAKASARAVAIPGNGSSGPYYLQASQVVPDSERVALDGVPQRRGIDYVVSYEIGSITFVNTAVAPSSVIEVTFEAAGANTRQGTVEAAGLSYDTRGAGRLSLTVMRQRPRGGTVASTRLEKFFGFGAPSIPYTLQFEPLPAAPIVIRVNGVLQREGVDYNFDPSNTAVFFFTRFMAPTDEIDVIYTPRPRQTVDGEREVIGLDYRIPLGKVGAITYTQATGRLKNPLNPLVGVARGLEGTFQVGGWSLSARGRDVPGTFVSIENRTLERNERAVDLNLTRAASATTRYGVTHNNSLITTRNTSSTGAVTFSQSRVSNAGLFYETAPEGRQPWRLTADRRRTRTGSNVSESDTLGLTTSNTFQRGNWRLGLTRQSGRAPTSFAPGATLRRFNVDGVVAGLSWQPSPRLALDAGVNLNRVRFGAREGMGRRVDATLTYQASAALGLALSHSDTDSGGVPILGGFVGGGVGLDGSGFTGGSGGSAFLGATGARVTTLGVDYRASERLSLRADAALTRSTGSVTSNSESQVLGVGAQFDMGERLRLNARVDSSRTSFLGSTRGRSQAVTFFGGLDGRWGRSSYSLRGSLFQSTGTSAFAQSGSTLELTYGYRIAPRQALALDLVTGSTRGYLPQSDFSAGIAWQYQLIDALALNVGYRFRDVRNRDASATSGAFRAGSFDVQLLFNFSR